jgi:hypothetical protein
MAWTKVTSEMLERIPERYRDSELRHALLRSWYSYRFMDNFVVMLMKYERNILVGVAKRNPRDKYNVKIGCQVAWVKAYRQFVKEHHDY